jgi:signal transduction histidine kinase
VAALRRTSPGVDIHAEVPTGVTIQGDRDRLAQILDNLLANALRHGAPPIRVTAEHDRTQVRILVTDAGPGVSESMRPRLFDRFATGRNKGGTGLGLFIVRELARAHRGDVTYDPPTQGTPAGRFVVDLPLVP